MKLRHFGLVVFLAFVMVTAGGCTGGPKTPPKDFFVTTISVTTLSTGETTSIFGKGFGLQRGTVLVGDKPAKIIKWKDKVIRIEAPAAQVERNKVEVKLPTGEQKYAGMIAIRPRVNDKLLDWVSDPLKRIDGSKMEPLLMVFKPVGPPVSGLFDYDAPIPKTDKDLINSIERACVQGVQVIQLHYPSNLSTGEEDYADTSMDNIRKITNEVRKVCPQALINIDDTDMPDGNRMLLRLMTVPSLEIIPNVGRFEPPADIKTDLKPITEASALRRRLTWSTDFFLHPIPVAMTTWQAVDLKQMAELQGVRYPPPVSFLLSMAYDDKAVDNKKTYDDIVDFLPADSRIIAAVTEKHVSEIIGYAVTKGDHVAYGYQYALHWPGGSANYIPDNSFVLEKIIQTAESIGRPIATPAQAREMLGYMARPSVNNTKIKAFTKVKPKRLRLKGRGWKRGAVAGPPSNTITAIGSDYAHKEIWIATDSGTYYTDDNTNSFVKVKLNIRGVRNVPVTKIEPTSNGAVWIATKGYGILKTVDHGNAVNRYTVERGALLGDVVTNLYTYGNEVYTCTFEEKDDGYAGTGVAYTTDSGANWFVWTSDYGLPFNDVRSVYVEDEWVYIGFGPYGGEGEATGMAMSPDFGDNWTMVKGIDQPVLAIRALQDNTIIVGTKGGGAYTVNYDGTHARRLKFIPPTATVTDLEIDNRGWLWLITDGGIIVTDDKGKSHQTFTVTDGVASEAVTGAVYIPGKDVWFSTTPDNNEHAGGMTRIIASGRKEQPKAAAQSQTKPGPKAGNKPAAVNKPKPRARNKPLLGPRGKR